MIKHLHIKNYALIDRMDLDFHPGFNVITGETGAGKSILIGGLSLILGQRAGKDAMRRPGEKIIVEAVFDLKNFDIRDFFEENDLDYDDETVIRREILPSGRSRAFINDTPVLLDTLSALGNRLVDIHAQHGHLLLKNKDFLYNLLDTFAGQAETARQYRKDYTRFERLSRKLQSLEEQKARLIAEADYRRFQLKELQELDWDLDFDEAEQIIRQKENREKILETLQEIEFLIDNEQAGLNRQLIELTQKLRFLAKFDDRADTWADRTEVFETEIRELQFDLQRLADTFALLDEEEVTRIENQYNKFQSLLFKHRLQTKEDLLALKNQWEREVNGVEALDAESEELREELKQLDKQLNEEASKLLQGRKQAAKKLAAEIEKHIKELGMEHSRIRINVLPSEDRNKYGRDSIEFLLSSDKGQTFGPMASRASGGEMSRIMLVIKFIMSKNAALPTIIFDEIDAGISGEIARKTASLLKQMSRHMQVVSITHLPQTAATGDKHFKVFKTENQGTVTSEIKALSPEERLIEIAEMIEGKPPSETALQHARTLLKNK